MKSECMVARNLISNSLVGDVCDMQADTGLCVWCDPVWFMHLAAIAYLHGWQENDMHKAAQPDLADISANATRQKETLSSTMMERIKRRLRKTAYRSHIVLQMVPEEDELHSHMHITPLRASRALGVRFVAAKFGLSMQNVTVRQLLVTAARWCCSGQHRGCSASAAWGQCCPSLWVW